MTYWAGRTDISASYKANALRALAMYVSPKLGGKLCAKSPRKI